MEKNMHIQMLGKTGEAIIQNFLMESGVRPTVSVDQWDPYKDGTFEKNGKIFTYEVKTEQPYVYKDMISFPENQLQKCLNVDYLFFVTVPPVMRPDYRHGGKIFLAKPKQMQPRYESYTTNGGKRNVGFRIEQKAIQYVRDLSSEDIRNLERHATSDYGYGYGWNKFIQTPHGTRRNPVRKMSRYEFN